MKKIIKLSLIFSIKLIKKIKYLIPINQRIKVKSYLYKLKSKVKQNIDSISEEVRLEWQDWDKYRQPQSFDLINFSVIPWDWRYQRPQHLAKYLTPNNRVFYIKNEFIPGKIINGFAPIWVEKKDTNIYEITLSASKNIFIYNEIPSKKDIKIIAASFKNLIYQADIINPIAKIDHPFWEYLSSIISMPKIYDCMDKHTGFEGTSSKLSTPEISLFKTSQNVLVSSDYLYKKASTYKNNENITILKNAGEYKHFNNPPKISDPLLISDITNIKGPIIGYYGAIAEWLDHHIIEDLLKKHPKKSIVLIGRVMNEKIEKLANKYSNLHLLGEKSYQLLPYYLQRFDVAIIPFVLNDLIKATHPVKIFEYFAGNRPVVTTKLPEIAELSDIVYFANSKNFSQKVSLALEKNKDNKQKISKANKYSKQNTWAQRTTVLNKIINNILFPKVSIILLSYNLPDLLDSAIRSILNRSFYPNLELIIVDNKSSPETLRVIKKHKKDKRVKAILNHKNFGFAKGNNIGLKQATGDYLIIINNDILITPGWICRLLFHIKKSNVGLVGVVTNAIGNEAKVELQYNPKNTAEFENRAREYTSKKWGSVMKLKNIAAFCWIKSKKTYKKIGGFDEQFKIGMFEDDDYCQRINNANLSILCAEDVFIHHYSMSSFKKLSFDKYMKIFNENKEKYEKKWNITWKQHKNKNQNIFMLTKKYLNKILNN